MRNHRSIDLRLLLFAPPLALLIGSGLLIQPSFGTTSDELFSPSFARDHILPNRTNAAALKALYGRSMTVSMGEVNSYGVETELWTYARSQAAQCQTTGGQPSALLEDIEPANEASADCDISPTSNLPSGNHRSNYLTIYLKDGIVQWFKLYD